MEKKQIKRIRWNDIWNEMEARDENGNPKPFSLVYCKKSTGEIRRVASCTLSSFHSKGATLNILYSGETSPRTIRKCLIIEFNGASVYL